MTVNWGAVAEDLWKLRRVVDDFHTWAVLADDIDVVSWGRPGDALYIRVHLASEETSIYVLQQRLGANGPRLFVEQVDEAEPMDEGDLRHYWDHLTAEAFVEHIEEER